MKWRIQVDGKVKGTGNTLSEALGDFGRRCREEGKSLERHCMTGTSYVASEWIREIDLQEIKILKGVEKEKKVVKKEYTEWKEVEPDEE